jgi:hypothetical protein
MGDFYLPQMGDLFTEEVVLRCQLRHPTLRAFGSKHILEGFQGRVITARDRRATARMSLLLHEPAVDRCAPYFCASGRDGQAGAASASVEGDSNHHRTKPE